MFDPLINILQALVVTAGGLGMAVGLCLKAVARDNHEMHAKSHWLMAAAAVGLLIGLTAEDIYNLIFSWMPG